MTGWDKLVRELSDHPVLREEMATLCRLVTGRDGMKAQGSTPSMLAAFGRNTNSASKPSVGVYASQLHYSRNGGIIGGDGASAFVEVYAGLPLATTQGSPLEAADMLCSHKEYAGLKPVVFPCLEPAERPRLTVHVVVEPVARPDKLRWVDGADRYIGVSLGCIVDGPRSADEIAGNLRSNLEEFVRTVHLMVGLFAQEKRRVTRAEVIGWCGEYAYQEIVNKRRVERLDWTPYGARVPYDFFRNSPRKYVEVKSSVVPELTEFCTFSTAELGIATMANNDKYEVWWVHIPKDVADQFLEILKRCETGPKATFAEPGVDALREIYKAFQVDGKKLDEHADSLERVLEALRSVKPEFVGNPFAEHLAPLGQVFRERNISGPLRVLLKPSRGTGPGNPGD